MLPQPPNLPLAAVDRHAVDRHAVDRHAVNAHADLSGTDAIDADWLLDPTPFVARTRASGGELSLENGLIRRTIAISPGAATVAIDHLQTGESFLRAVGPEMLVTLDGKLWNVGGLLGQKNRAFLTDNNRRALKADPGAFSLIEWRRERLESLPPRVAWKRTTLDSGETSWPPRGEVVTLVFGPPPGAPNVRITLFHALHDGLPLLETWASFENRSETAVRVDSFALVRLAFAEPESIVDNTERWLSPNVTATTDYSFGGMASASSSGAVRWTIDPDYATQVNYEKTTPCLLKIAPPLGPSVDLSAGESLATFRALLLLHDSDNRERKGLATRKLYRTLAPWTRQNPLLHHVTSVDPGVVKTAIDQCADVGFEMVILSFGSGLNMEDTRPETIAKFRALADYAHSRGVKLGGYSLLASRRISDEHDVLNPKTGKTGGAIFGNSPCLCSAWGETYFANVRKFLAETGFDLLEHDGSYPGDACASTTHPGHRGLDDSVWKQHAKIVELYAWCRARGISLNVPDWYFLNGSTKTGMGYRETNWSLPRAEQVLHGRQNLYDGTWEKTPSQGWMFVPLVEYQGGGAAATIEPLSEHLPDYERHLQNNLGFGVQACYRGPRLYDTKETRALVKKWVDWFKKHRAILESDLVHWRRADGRQLDGVVHVNPNLPERALAILFNPTDQTVEQTVRIPLYYARLKDRAGYKIADGPKRTVKLQPDGSAKISVRIPPQSMQWIVFGER